MASICRSAQAVEANEEESAMRTYQLQIYIDPKSLERLVQAGTKIVISKQASYADPTIAWLAFSPYEASAVEWQDRYSIYTSRTVIQSQAIISQLANHAAVAGSAYGFNDNSFSATAPHSTLGPGTYEVVNQSSQPLTFGLAQGASVNGSTLRPNVVSAASVQPGQWLDMTPPETETITVFLSNNAVSSMFLGSTSGPIMTIKYFGDTFRYSISYDPYEGGFRMK
jgi:hypothetical protein